MPPPFTKLERGCPFHSPACSGVPTHFQFREGSLSSIHRVRGGFWGWVPVLGACHLRHLPELLMSAAWTLPGPGWTCRIPRATSVVQLESAIFRISENSTPQLWRIRAPGSKDINPDSQASSVRGHPQETFCQIGNSELGQGVLLDWQI